MAWLLLLVASVIEIAMGVSLKYAEGWTRFWPSVGGIFFALLSVFVLTFAMRHLPAGTAYAVWTGIGAVGIATLGMVLFGDPATPLRVGCIALIIVGVVGLRFVEG
ncbi:multidrug efflux SMR transporter [Mesorhizobium sp. 1M-11]|uniref:DMT family transporter n=1 Tax=Mesorhizobium sp. 1M-11 TaxID=1529006 RepID=UPI0006C76148|nr:multidrug efflux SMR transporter [Mesorhizobium sp. 1M-11]